MLPENPPGFAYRVGEAGPHERSVKKQWLAPGPIAKRLRSRCNLPATPADPGVCRVRRRPTADYMILNRSSGTVSQATVSYLLQIHAEMAQL
jgi:hypothetical protein